MKPKIRLNINISFKSFLFFSLPYAQLGGHDQKNGDTLLDMCVSSLRRGHANLLCIVPILADDPPKRVQPIMQGSPYKGSFQCKYFYRWVKIYRLNLIKSIDYGIRTWI